jgi:pilus assembly protein CpaF
MLRRLVSTNTTEFKKPPAKSAPEPALPVEAARPVASAPPASENGSGESGSGLINTTASAGNVQTNGGPADSGGFLDRNAATDNSYATFSSDKFTEIKMMIHQQLLDTMNLSVLDKMSEEQIRSEVGDLVRELLVENNVPLTLQEQQSVIADILDEVLGLGPIEPLLKDPTVSDILVNGYDMVVVERFGRLEMTPVKFKDNRHLLRIIDKIVSAIGRRIDEGSPMVDARLLDGSRVNAVIAPIAVDGPLLSIRRFAQDPYTIDRLIEIGTITPNIAELLEGIVRARQNILISGGTGSGKTTMLNAMAAYIEAKERIITIEDAAELQLQQPQIARMETRPPNVEGRGEIAQRELVKNALRMRPDRIIVGEVR